MQKFLQSVAADLWQRYGARVGELRILMPNTRTRVFLVDELSRLATQPIWAPEYLSIDSLMVSLAGLERVDQIGAITELYSIYAQYHHEESFDSFYRWGEVLLGDFDAVDKYLIDAQMLFSNIADLKEIEASPESYMSPEQLQMVGRFWREMNSSQKESPHKQRFLSIWRTLLPVYESFRQRLESQGVGYTGMIYRRAAERLRSGEAELPRGGYVVVGFNALSEAEKILFDHLKRIHEADFYWDWDDYYLSDEKQEAGLFVRENIRRYPPPPSFRLESSFAEPKQMRVISTASNSLQCKYVGEFVEEIISQKGGIDRNTAIVLTDENLLSPLLYSLPDSVGSVNITMGYPLKATLPYSFVERLLQLQLRARTTKAGVDSFYHSDVEGLLAHPFIVAAVGDVSASLRAEVARRGRIYVERGVVAAKETILERIFLRVDHNSGLREYLLEIMASLKRDGAVEIAAGERKALMVECFGLIAESLIKMDNSVARCALEMKLSTYVALLRRILQTLRIPYSGEPLSGVQVMGILETRNLDFDNVVLLSMNDDNFPSGRIADNSFIPYNLRFAYSMPTTRHREGVYAYYFYRLLQRARRVDMVYCSVASDKASGEQSRYIYQLDFESPHSLQRVEKSLNVNLAEQRRVEVAKRGDVMRRLEEFLVRDDETQVKKLSPSIFNNYMECPLKFYFKAIAGIRTDEEIEEGVDEALFGTLFHKAAELLYKPLVGRVEPPQELLANITHQQIHSAVVEAITQEYFMGEEVAEEEYGGNLLVVRDTVERYLKECLIPFDSDPARGSYRLYRLEQPTTCDFSFGERSVRFFGYSDRIDKMPDGSLRIIDYKTGSLHKDFAGLSTLLSRLPEGRNGAVVQTLIYSMMVESMQRSGQLDGQGATPSLYYIRHLRQKEYSPLLNDRSCGLPVESYADYREEFEDGLRRMLCELFDPKVPFVPTDDEKVCRWCDFAKICRR